MKIEHDECTIFKKDYFIGHDLDMWSWTGERLQSLLNEPREIQNSEVLLIISFSVTVVKIQLLFEIIFEMDPFTRSHVVIRKIAIRMDVDCRSEFAATKSNSWFPFGTQGFWPLQPHLDWVINQLISRTSPKSEASHGSLIQFWDLQPALIKPLLTLR